MRIVNTAPLIFLGKLDRLDLLRMGVDSVIVPTTVLLELQAVKDEATEAVDIALNDWLQQMSCTLPALLELITQSIDPGEAEVLALAREFGTPHVVLDDLDARRYARRMGLQPIGTLGLLLAAKKIGELGAVLPEIESLRSAGFRASEELVRRVLQEAGE